jgi:predicted nucleic acid-binding protein
MRFTSVRSFFDTNVLAYTDDADSPGKSQRALELLARHRQTATGAVSTQVLQEYYSVATRKLGVSPQRAREKVELFGQLDLVVVTLDHVLAAIHLHRLYQLSIWDALIVEAARRAQCEVLFTEDIQSAPRINGVEIVNPFA